MDVIVSNRHSLEYSVFLSIILTIFMFQNEVCKFNYDYYHAASSGKIENPVAFLCASLRRTPGNKKNDIGVTYKFQLVYCSNNKSNFTHSWI